MKHLIRLTALLLIILMLPTASALKLSPEDVFQGDSYWTMTCVSSEGEVLETYYVYLAEEHHASHVVSSSAEYYVDWNSDWQYDAENETLEIRSMMDGENSGTFQLRDGELVVDGVEHDTVLTYSPNSKKYNAAISSFRWNYGSCNFTESLRKLPAYLDFNLWTDDFYESFRHMAMFETRGIVQDENEDVAAQVEQEFDAILGADKPQTYRVTAVLGGISMPKQNTWIMAYTSRTEIVNLVYTDPEARGRAFQTLSAMRDDFLTGEAEDEYTCANDLFAASASGNEKELAVILELPCSVAVVRGSASQAKEILTSLGMGNLLEES